MKPVDISELTLEQFAFHEATWVVGYKYDTFNPHPWMYLDLDLAERQRATK